MSAASGYRINEITEADVIEFEENLARQKTSAGRNKMHDTAAIVLGPKLYLDLINLYDERARRTA